MTTPKKILFVSHYAGRTGAPIVLLHFLRWFKEHATFEFEILLKEGGVLEADFAQLASVEKLVSTNKSRTPASWFSKIQNRLKEAMFPNQLERFCRNRQWDLIYSNTITNGKIVARAAACGCPVITHVHEMDYWIHRSGSENWKLVKKQTSHFIAASNAVKKNLVERHGIAEERVSVVHEFVQVSEPSRESLSANTIREQLGISQKDFVLGGSGAEFWRKGRDLIVHLLVILKRRAPESKIHIIWIGREGDQMEKLEFWHDLNQAGVASQCHVTGEITNPLDYFAAIDAFILLSREDPFPLVCLEAASLEKPILCFDGAGGIPELVENDAGFVVPYLDMEAMADKILWLMQHPVESQRLGKCGAQKIKERFSVDVLAPKILETIQHLLNKNGGH